jgi:hypothetical protein
MSDDFKVEAVEDGGFVRVGSIRGPVTVELASSFMKEAVAVGDRLGVCRCLLDIRGTTSASGVVGKYRFAYERARELGLSPQWRIAVLKDRGDDSPDFIETVMTNAGLSCRIFEDEAAAVGWLSEKESS